MSDETTTPTDITHACWIHESQSEQRRNVFELVAMPTGLKLLVTDIPLEGDLEELVNSSPTYEVASFNEGISVIGIDVHEPFADTGRFPGNQGAFRIQGRRADGEP
jgi:hypothetical protein